MHMPMMNRRTTLKLAAAFGLANLLDIPTSSPAAGAKSEAAKGALQHPGLLHTADDFARMRQKVAAGAEPWKSGWDKLIANPHASLKWKPRPAETIFRGKSKDPENYPQLYNDIAAAYACGLRWKISGD